MRYPARQPDHSGQPISELFIHISYNKSIPNHFRYNGYDLSFFVVGVDAAPNVWPARVDELVLADFIDNFASCVVNLFAATAFVFRGGEASSDAARYCWQRF